MNQITRFGVSIEADLLEKFDTYIKKKHYTNRSEAIRDIIRKNIVNEKTLDPTLQTIAIYSMIYDHHESRITKKLLDIQHDHHHEIIISTHIHIDHDNCLEILLLKGKVGDLQHLADMFTSLKGVKHGEFTITKTSI